MRCLDEKSHQPLPLLIMSRIWDEHIMRVAHLLNGSKPGLPPVHTTMSRGEPYLVLPAALYRLIQLDDKTVSLGPDDRNAT